MTVYILGLICTVILMSLSTKYSKQTRRIILTSGQHNVLKAPKMSKMIPIIPLTVIAAIRYGVGQDYFYTYTKIFEKVIAGRADEAWGDIGYTLLNRLVAIFSSDYASIFVVTAIIFCFCILKSIYNNSEDQVMSSYLLVCSGYYFCFLNGMRQMIAISIMMISLKYIKEHNGIKFALCVMIASLFHLTALIFIPVYFFNKLNLNNRKRLLIVLACYVLSGPLSILASKIIMLTKYSWYISGAYSTERLGYISALMGIIILLFACIYGKEKDKLLIDLQMIAVCINAFIGEIPLASRLVWIFGTSVIFLIPNVVKNIQNKTMRQFVIIGIYALYFLYFIYTVGVKNSNNVLPYMTIFSR